MLGEIDIVHLGGEMRRVSVVNFTQTEIMFIWPMCGVYYIRVKDNVCVRAKRRWKAFDHQALKELHWKLLAEQADRISRAKYK